MLCSISESFYVSYFSTFATSLLSFLTVLDSEAFSFSKLSYNDRNQAIIKEKNKVENY